jgi:DNA-binding transcriptional ArsR family regulator
MSTDHNLTFGALADPTRRSMPARLAMDEATVTALTVPFAMSGPAISKRLKVLERAGRMCAVAWRSGARAGSKLVRLTTPPIGSSTIAASGSRVSIASRNIRAVCRTPAEAVHCRKRGPRHADSARHLRSQDSASRVKDAKGQRHDRKK